MSRLSPYTTNGRLSPLFAEETAKAAQRRLFHLITLYITMPVPNSTLFNIEEVSIADSNYNVTYTHKTASGTATKEYVAFPAKFTGATINSDGTIDKATLIVANVSREIMRYISAAKGLQGCRVSIKSVYENALDFIYTPNNVGGVDTEVNVGANSSAFIEEEYIVDSYQASEQAITFNLDPVIDLEIRLPRRRFMVDSCFWTFKDIYTCKYAGGVATCDKTMDSCRAKNNEVNFGGFPGISGTRKVFL